MNSKLVQLQWFESFSVSVQYWEQVEFLCSLVLSKFKSWNSEQLNPAHQNRGRGRGREGRKLRLVVYLGVIHERSQKIRCPARCNGVIYQGMGARAGRLVSFYWLLGTNTGRWLEESWPRVEWGWRNVRWDINCVLALQSNTNTKWKQQTLQLHICSISEREGGSNM